MKPFQFNASSRSKISNLRNQLPRSFGEAHLRYAARPAVQSTWRGKSIFVESDPKQTPEASELAFFVSPRPCDHAPAPLRWELRDFGRGGSVRPDCRCHSQWRRARMVLAPR